MANRQYETEQIRVYWNSDRCIHSAICLNGLPEVFDTGRRPWVAVNAAAADAIAETIEKCPSGALRYERLDNVPGEQPLEQTTVVPWPNGPLTIRGNVRIRTAEGEVIAEESRFSLCRCGASQNQPFCDNSHRRVGFSDSEPAVGDQRRSAHSPEDVHQGRGIDESAGDG